MTPQGVRAASPWGRRAALLAWALLWLASPAAAGSLLAVCQGAAQVDILDTATGTLTASIPVAKAPAGLAVSRDGAFAFITHPDLGLLTRLDLQERRVQETAHIGGQPFGIAMAPDGTLYVGDWSGDRILRLDGRTLAVTGAVAVGRAPAHLALDREGRTLYSADRESDVVSVIALPAFTRIAQIAVGRAPYALDASDPAFVAVADVRSGAVSLIAKADHAVTRIGGLKMPYGVAPAPGGRLLAVDQQTGTLDVIDLAMGRIVQRVRLGGSPESVVTDSAAGRAYVTEWFANRVTILDLADYAILTRTPGCDGPRAIALSPPAD